MSIQFLQGDSLSVLKNLSDESIHCCVTSPPYFGLRNYGVDGQRGLEKTPEEYVTGMVEVFREVKRVLRKDGTFWLNIGDSYAGYHGNKNHLIPTSSANGWNNGYNENLRVSTANKNGLKQKDLIGIPWRLAFALQADGWYLRSDIIWHKPNVMPSSVRDRPTTAHEYIFLLSKSPKYYYDYTAIKEDALTLHAVKKTWQERKEMGEPMRHGLQGAAACKAGGWGTQNGKRNKRSVWSVNTRPYKGAHFATFPPDLIRPCILAGCPEGGTVLDPFGGSGTTGQVAQEHGRNAILIELNTSYIELAKQRCGIST